MDRSERTRRRNGLNETSFPLDLFILSREAKQLMSRETPLPNLLTHFTPANSLCGPLVLSRTVVLVARSDL